MRGLTTMEEKEAIFADDYRRWDAAVVARKVLKRVEAAGDEIHIFERDIETLHQMAYVLHLGRRYLSPFGGGWHIPGGLTVPTADILAVFEE